MTFRQRENLETFVVVVLVAVVVFLAGYGSGYLRGQDSAAPDYDGILLERHIPSLRR